MTDALIHEVFLPEAVTDAATVAAPVAAPTLGHAERIEVKLSSNRRREHPSELLGRLMAEMMTGRTPGSVIARREGICASVLHRWQRVSAGPTVPFAPPRLLPVQVEAPVSKASRVAAGLEVCLVTAGCCGPSLVSQARLAETVAVACRAGAVIGGTIGLDVSR